MAALFVGVGLYWQLFYGCGLVLVALFMGVGLYWRLFYEELLFYMKMALLTKYLLNETVAR